ncbi:GNAT family N-acetyltransferase [Tateyamaria omphalii]|uniref:GNAT family N-acetyltransferase n=1 Tax=Tateyamaria omphalii TaxID=299262 RepID=UPI001678E170|nr:GNAT family N-acetyltransferase [Tateyamaria omphalii]
MSAQQGWPHGLADWEQMFRLGHGRVALLNGQVVGTTLWWLHDRAATLGMVIVDQTQRGRGIAGSLVADALDRIGDLPVMLTATDMARSGYARLGFRKTGMVDTFRSIPNVVQSPDARIDALFDDDVLALDALARGWAREAVLRSFMAHGAICWALKKAGRLVAFALDRELGSARIIGPLVAPDVETAEALVRHCISVHPRVQVRIDSNPVLGLSDRLSALGLNKVSWGTVMVRGTTRAKPNGAPILFGLASQAFG